MADIEIDLQGCEHCSKEFPIEKMTMMGDYWFCLECFAAWLTFFNQCNHEFEPETNSEGEPGQFCSKCNGFVRDKDMADLVKS